MDTERVESVEQENYGYNVIVVGAGQLYEQKLQDALQILGSVSRRTVIDINPDRIHDLEEAGLDSKGYPVLANAATFNFNDLIPRGTWTDEELDRYRENTVAVVATPNHLETIQNLARRGVHKILVEKPMVNNMQQVAQLEALMQQDPELKVFPIDFYEQKIVPLSVLTGAVTPEDPQFRWVVDEAGNPVSADLVGKLHDMIGDIESIDAAVNEGGGHGVSDFITRPWLEQNPESGGMLLDLGTHALAPLMVAGLIDGSKVSVASAFRRKLGSDRVSQVPMEGNMPETKAKADLVAEMDDGRKIIVSIDVGKVAEDGGKWHYVVRGSKGEAFMGLRTGQSLLVNPNKGPVIKLRLREGSDAYKMAFVEAKRYFDGVPGTERNYTAMRYAIDIIDRIKAAS